MALVGVAAAVRCAGGRIAEARIGLTSMGPTPVRAAAVEAALAGAQAAEESVAEAASAAAEGTRPAADLSGSAAYRAHLARVLPAGRCSRRPGRRDGRQERTAGAGEASPVAREEPAGSREARAARRRPRRAGRSRAVRVGAPGPYPRGRRCPRPRGASGPAGVDGLPRRRRPGRRLPPRAHPAPPALREGEAGAGKTALAAALADVLGAPLVRLQCYEGIDASQALYLGLPAPAAAPRAAEAAGHGRRPAGGRAVRRAVRRPAPLRRCGRARACC
ncbi:hypothetical protein ACHZ98_12055 [Streptomyces sp. MAR4 CNY-716]